MLIIKKIDNLLYNELEPDPNFQLPKRIAVAKFVKKPIAYYTIIQNFDIDEVNYFFNIASAYDIKILDLGVSSLLYNPLDFPKNLIFVTSNFTRSNDKEIIFPFWLDNIDTVPVPKNEILNPEIFFHSWMRIPRPHRIDLVNKLIEKNLIDKGEVKISHFSDLFSVLDRDDNKRSVNITDQFINFEKNKKYILDKVDSMPNTNNTNNAWQINYLYRYNRMLDIVPETTIDFQTPWVSEKIWKPVRAGQLFLSWGTSGNIECLRQKGFNTFDHYIDHSYDSIKEHTQRLDALTDELKRLCNLPEKEKFLIWKATKTDRLKNKNHLRGSLYFDFLQQLKEKI